MKQGQQYPLPRFRTDPRRGAHDGLYFHLPPQEVLKPYPQHDLYGMHPDFWELVRRTENLLNAKLIRCPEMDDSTAYNRNRYFRLEGQDRYLIIGSNYNNAEWQFHSLQGKRELRTYLGSKPWPTLQVHVLCGDPGDKASYRCSNPGCYEYEGQSCNTGDDVALCPFSKSRNIRRQDRAA